MKRDPPNPQQNAQRNHHRGSEESRVNPERLTVEQHIADDTETSRGDHQGDRGALTPRHRHHATHGATSSRSSPRVRACARRPLRS